MHKHNLRAALLGSGAAVAMMAASAPVAADEIQDLKAQIESLQVQLDSLESRQAVSESRGTVAPAAAVEAGSKPKSWLLPGTNTSMNIGGYAKLDLLYDFGPDLGDSIGQGPVLANNRRQNVFTLHARQSRFWIKTWTPTDWGELATHIEGDFFGAGGNQLISNSNTLRARHLYGSLGPVLAGQTWSTWMAVDTLPETLDFTGPAAAVFARQAQIRYSHSFGGGWTAAVAVENPESSGNTGPESLGGTGIDHAPDFTGRLKYSHSKGHVSGRGIVRYLAEDNGGVAPATSDSDIGWGVGVDAVYLITDNDAVGAEFNYGEGIGRYMTLGSGTDFTFTGGGGAAQTFKANTVWGGYGWYQHKWTDTVRTNVVFGAVFDEPFVNQLGAPASNGLQERVYTAHGNIIWSPVSQVNFGFEVIWLNADGVRLNDRDAIRLQLGMQYKF